MWALFLTFTNCLCLNQSEISTILTLDLPPREVQVVNGNAAASCCLSDSKPLSLTLIMTDAQSQTPKNSSNRFFKARKWFKETLSKSHSRSTSPQPPASAEVNRGREISSVQHVIVSSGAQLIIPVVGASAATRQQGVSNTSWSQIEYSAQHADRRTPTHLLRSQPPSASRDPSVSSVVQSE